MDLLEYLKSKPYPGRGIALGRSADGRRAVMTYFIMGRSENSRNRVFEPTEDGIRTRAYDEAKLVDPSLIIYHPVRSLSDGRTIVTNGDQTDTIRDFLTAGQSFQAALNTRTFEPDGPNWTPRISGLVERDGTYQLSILKSLEGSESCCCRYFFDYETAVAGVGHFISTYQGDGDPLPSFQGEPRSFSLGNESAQEWAEQVWAALNKENRVALFVRTVDLATGETETALKNRHN